MNGAGMARTLRAEIAQLQGTANTLRAEITQLQAERGELCEEAARLQRKIDLLMGEARAGCRLLEEMREFETEYRARLVAWLETGLAAMKGPEVPR